MAMELTGLDLAIRRMQSIERQFESLSNFGDQVGIDNNFQQILDSAMSGAQDSPDESQNVSDGLPVPKIQPLSDVDNVSASEKVFSPKVNNITKKLNNPQIDSLIEKYASKHGMDSAFVKAVIKQESGFKTDAKSYCGAMGLMQLMPATAMAMGVHNAYDAEQNIAGGTKYLKGLLDRFNGDKKLALAAYNAGPGAVNKYGGVPPYKETQNYVKNIMSNYEAFKGGSL